MKGVYTFTHFGRLQKAFYHNSVKQNLQQKFVCSNAFYGDVQQVTHPVSSEGRCDRFLTFIIKGKCLWMGSFAIFVENIILTQPREIEPNFYYLIRLHPFPTLPPWGLQIYIDRCITIKINTDLIKLITCMLCFLESNVNIILTFPFRCVSPVK